MQSTEISEAIFYPSVKRSSKKYKRLLKLHKWFGIVLTIFIVLFSLSGIFLNHRELISSVDVNRKYLPEVYRYNNWNLAAIRGNVNLPGDTNLVYGNIGAWKVSDGFTSWHEFNQGLPEGIDKRKISKILQAGPNWYFAGTLFGLYEYKGTAWEKLSLPGSEQRITDLFFRDGLLHVLTRSHLLQADLSGSAMVFKEIQLPLPEDFDNKVSLFRTLWVIHSGEILGISGKLFSDVMGLVFIFFSVSGIILWLFPGLIKRLKKRKSSVKHQVNTLRWSLKWHNKIGYILTLFLIIITITGMFLRPPLLIPIAGSRVGKIPFTMLDDGNPWHDKLRACNWDHSSSRYILSTSDGFYYSEDHFLSPLKKFKIQPPVSVMGINVFEPIGHGGFLVGSFSGLFTWFPDKDYIENAISRKEFQGQNKGGKPFSDDAISGIIWTGEGKPILFDYANGAKAWMHENEIPNAPDEIL